VTNRRVLAVAAPVAYFVALGASIAAWGLPLARDQFFFWLGLGMAAFSAGAWRTWGGMVLEWLPIFALLVLYDFLRGAVAVTADQAHVAPQVAFDKAIGGGEVPTVWLQDHLWNAAHLHWYDFAVWAVYLSHFFVVWVVAAVLWRLDRARFRRYAAVAVTLTCAAFLTYWLYPAQPPWLWDSGIDRVVPTVWDHLGVQTMQSVYENDSLVNTVAAMPSLHAAYPFMILLFFWGAAGRVGRAGLALYAFAMAFTLVYGGEHIVLDKLVGGAIAAGAFVLVCSLVPAVKDLVMRRALVEAT
jgi:hypothetical protein